MELCEETFGSHLSIVHGKYIKNILIKHNHPMPLKPQLSSYKHCAIKYSAKVQHSMEEDTSPPLDAVGIKRFQQVVGSLLYYARAFNKKKLVALNATRIQQAVAMQATAEAISQLLDYLYVATYPNDDTIYCSRGIVLVSHSDAGFNKESKYHSRADAYIFLSEDDPEPRWNGSILTIAQLIKFVMASAAKAELGALHVTANE